MIGNKFRQLIVARQGQFRINQCGLVSLKGEIEVVYSPGKQKGVQNKNVTIVANTEPKQTILRIKAEVEEIPGAANATPAASSNITIGG